MRKIIHDEHHLKGATRSAELVPFLTEKARTRKEIAEFLGVKIASVDSYLTRLAKRVDLVVDFQYGRTVYSIPKPTAGEAKS